MCIGYCAIELRSHGIHKQLKPRIFVQTGALPSKVRVVGSIPIRGLEVFFLPFFCSISFLAFLTLRIYPGVCASVERVQRIYLAGLIDFDYKHSSGRNLAYGSTANFLFRGPIA